MEKATQQAAGPQTEREKAAARHVGAEASWKVDDQRYERRADEGAEGSHHKGYEDIVVQA